LEILRRNGYSAWIDQEHLFELDEAGPTNAERKLAEHLRKAMQTCNYVIFFETYAQLAAVMNGPSQRVKSWQEHELDIAEAERIIVLYHGSKPPVLTFGQNKNVFGYIDLDEAFDLILKGIREPSIFFQKVVTINDFLPVSRLLPVSLRAVPILICKRHRRKVWQIRKWFLWHLLLKTRGRETSSRANR
jgi:hypothetical protein